MPNFIIRYHPEFFKDLERLSKSQLEAAHKKIERIKEAPEQFKDLSGGAKCYSTRIENMRLVYYFDGTNLWFLILESRKGVYEEYVKRLYKLKTRLE